MSYQDRGGADKHVEGSDREGRGGSARKKPERADTADKRPDLNGRRTGKRPKEQ